MRIGINLLNLSQERFGGVEQYISNLVRCLAESEEEIRLFLFLRNPFRDLFPDSNARIKKVLFKRLRDVSDIHKAIHENQLDVWFCPLHKSYLSNIRIPVVAVIHDVLHTSYPDFVSGDLEWNNQYYQKFTPNFDAMITVSSFSKEAIVRNLGIPEEKIHVIYEDAPSVFSSPPDLKTKEAVREKYRLPDAYAFYPASYNPHKNHHSLLNAFLLLKEKYNMPLSVVLTGYFYKGNKVYEEVLQFIKKNKLEAFVKLLGYIPAKEMPYLYYNSSFIVFPSLYEGFGIPLVEAMKTGTPIVCSDRGSIPEITGGAALMFNPEDPEEMALQMLQVHDKKQELIKKGAERAKTFSWKKSAQDTLAVFRSVLSQERSS
ncbi:glycosyltransferase family 4 protein [Bacillus sp. ISL-47]|uniref:glycosyltransferase family 4 protein n=1 Tax=Bacillus sp. ISL-47 TaxID=2819130 RepID=UPI001BE9B62F|nr:glycosyltransferase family 1 protein [Bacillus sp. ISL-47]MBT2689114.1 glycosyltransferase family 4 protein [Bacillus sp. ISL-47]